MATSMGTNADVVTRVHCISIHLFINITFLFAARGSVSFSEIERYVARRGGICNGCKDEDDIHEAFQVRTC